VLSRRERFLQIARFERANDPFVWGVDAWNETFRRWVKEGMPVRANYEEVRHYFLGDNDVKATIKPNANGWGLGENNNPPWVAPLDPLFEPEILQVEEEHLIKKTEDGTIVRIKKDDYENSMPQWLEYPVKDKKSWDEYKKRLDPHSPGRYPAGWDIMSPDTVEFPLKEDQKGKKFSERDFALGMECLSLYGLPRQYMGLENLSFALFENMKLVEEIIEWQTYMSLEMLKHVFDAGVTLDFAWMFEDMCFNLGPLVSPEFVKKYMAPNYRKVVDLLRKHGVDIIFLDSDGNIEKLLPIWLDCGINGTFPLEVASGMDAVKLRKKYGKELIMIGNIDKRSLAKGKNAIDKEVEKVKILLKDGGYFINCDHHIPPDVSFENISYFFNQVKKLSDYKETD